MYCGYQSGGLTQKGFNTDFLGSFEKDD